jgi:4-diphosphocytidyl-2-C-methyl-D-erythritol kinase
MDTLTLPAPAKINLRLDVLSRRPDGYHELRMIMQQLELGDEITISRQVAPGVVVSCDQAGVPVGSANIAWRAARTLLDRHGRDDGLLIAITKHIPVAAGLGGGSSDAAAVLMGVNRLLELGSSREELMELGVKLGADVPFFIYGLRAIAEGIGEKLSPIVRLPEMWVVLVNPKVPVSTAWVYKNLQLTSKKINDILPRSFEDVDAVCAVMANDLETVTIPSFPVIGEIKEQLLAHGASGAMMSGSGPTVFGIFSAADQARHAAEVLSATTGWFVAVTKPIR